MVLPLYCNSQVHLPKDQDTSNAGLRYDKFCNLWQDQPGWSLKTGKLAWINSIHRSVGHSPRIEEAKQRLIKMATALGGLYRVYQTEWRFVTGLGRNHPVENGFAWHATLGTPYLPGSSVKGVVKDWATNWAESRKETTELNRIFGCGHHVGSVIFFEALPTKAVQLDADIMTPHFDKYYQANEPPADWHSPIPIPFLTVAPDQSFLFVLAPRLDDLEVKKDVELAAQWLEEALSFTGAGAKTAAGYGRFIRDVNAEAGLQKLLKDWQQQAEQAKRAEQLAQMSPIRREMEKDGYSKEAEIFMAAMTNTWLSRMEQEAHPETRLEIAELLANWYQVYKQDQWAKPNKKNSEKIKKIRAVLQQK